MWSGHPECRSVARWRFSARSGSIHCIGRVGSRFSVPWRLHRWPYRHRSWSSSGVHALGHVSIEVGHGSLLSSVCRTRRRRFKRTFSSERTRNHRWTSVVWHACGTTCGTTCGSLSAYSRCGGCLRYLRPTMTCGTFPSDATARRYSHGSRRLRHRSSRPPSRQWRSLTIAHTGSQWSGTAPTRRALSKRGLRYVYGTSGSVCGSYPHRRPRRCPHGRRCPKFRPRHFYAPMVHPMRRPAGPGPLYYYARRRAYRRSHCRRRLWWHP